MFNISIAPPQLTPRAIDVHNKIIYEPNTHISSSPYRHGQM